MSFLEVHAIQNFAFSNLNRDETGMPKTGMLGGLRRDRLSSQSGKRATRRGSEFTTLLEAHGGIRTRMLVREVSERLANNKPAPSEIVEIVAGVFDQGGIAREQKPNGQYKENTKIILFVDQSAVDQMVEHFRRRMDALRAGDRDSMKEMVGILGDLLAQTKHSPDIALFGRMIEVKDTTPFGKKQLGIDGSCQVAHALSTNVARPEMDFFTAVEELAKPGENGAAMMDVAGYTSPCYYRYANIDLCELAHNLGGNHDVATETVCAFVEAFACAVPSGKQTATAAQCPSDLVFVVLRERRLWSLVNAFVKPIKPTDDQDLVELSILALGDYWRRLVGMYGADDLVGRWCATTCEKAVSKLTDSLGTGREGRLTIVSLPALVKAVRKELGDTEHAELWECHRESRQKLSSQPTAS